MGMVDDYRRRLEANQTGGVQTPVPGPGAQPVPQPAPQVPLPPVGVPGGQPVGGPAPVPMPGPQSPAPPASGHGGFPAAPAPVMMPSPHLGYLNDHPHPRLAGLPSVYGTPSALDFSTIPTQMAQQLAQRSSPMFQGRF